MQTASVLIALSGDSGNTVPKVVSAAEIPVLQGIHGDAAVFDIQPLEAPMLDEISGKPIGNREDLMRLRRIYGSARDGENHRIVDVIYPGAGARLPETIAELGLPESLFKAITRATAAPVAAEAPVDAAPATKTKGKGKKADTEAAPAAPADEGDDGVGDMPDAEQKLFA